MLTVKVMGKSNEECSNKKTAIAVISNKILFYIHLLYFVCKNYELQPKTMSWVQFTEVGILF